MRDLARERGFMAPRIGLEFVATRGNIEELSRLPELAKALPLPTGWPVRSADWRATSMEDGKR